MMRDWPETFRSWGVLREGHFLLTSGRHGAAFLLFAEALQHPDRAELLGRALADLFRGEGIETVIGPAMGGVLLAHEVARALSVRSIYAEKDGERMALRRGFGLRPGERVLAVEDAVTTGGSVAKVLEICRGAGADVVGVGVCCDRTGGRADLGAPVRALWNADFPSYPAEDCPLCRRGLPLVRPKA